MSQFSVENHTRFVTKDLTALVQFCVDNAIRSTGAPPIPDTFHFFEFRPHPKAKMYNMSRFGRQAKDYTPEYKTLPVQYAKSVRSNHGVIWLAAPEVWLPELAQLSMEGQEASAPPAAIQHIADRIKAFWHFRNVEAELPTQLRVLMVAPKQVRSVKNALLKRQKFMNTVGDFVTYGQETSRALTHLRNTHGRLIADGRAAAIPALLNDVDVDSSLKGAIEKIAEATASLKTTLALIHKQEETR
jgi:hypothetical protein